MRTAIEAHFLAIARDEDEAGAIYADDAVLEYVQSGERIVGREAIIATRKAYPGRPAAFAVDIAEPWDAPAYRAAWVTC